MHDQRNVPANPRDSARVSSAVGFASSLLCLSGTYLLDLRVDPGLPLAIVVTAALALLGCCALDFRASPVWLSCGFFGGSIVGVFGIWQPNLGPLVLVTLVPWTVLYHLLCLGTCWLGRRFGAPPNTRS